MSAPATVIPFILTEVTPVLALQSDPPQSQDLAAVCDPDLWLYRERTIGLLKRYMRLSGEIGRLPSLLGREFFRTRVTSYHVFTFEDGVIFVHDVERCLEQLNEWEKQLISVIVLQEHSHESAARRIGCGRRSIGRHFPETLDRLSELFLEGGLLRRLPQTEPRPEKSCQEGKIDEIPVSDSNCTK